MMSAAQLKHCRVHLTRLNQDLNIDSDQITLKRVMELLDYFYQYPQQYLDFVNGK